jgi:hypothetical protein
MDSPDPIPLDAPEEVSEEGPAFPEIPAWEVVDKYSGVRVSLTVREGDFAQLTMTHGDPADGPYQVLRFDVDPKDLARLASDHIAPLVAWEKADREWQAMDMDKRAAQSRAEADICAWVVDFTAEHPLGPSSTQLRVHRSSCSALKRGGRTPTGEHTPGGTHDGSALLRALVPVRDALERLVGADLIQAKKNALSMREAGRIRDTAPDRRPLILCLACKPLGEETADLMRIVTDLAEVTELRSVDHGTVIIHLMFRMQHLVWENEQRHLDYLRERRGIQE